MKHVLPGLDPFLHSFNNIDPGRNANDHYGHCLGLGRVKEVVEKCLVVMITEQVKLIQQEDYGLGLLGAGAKRGQEEVQVL